MVDPEEALPDSRLDELLRASGQVWPQTDEALDAWLASQALSDEDEGWLRDVVRRRVDEAGAEPVPAGAAIGSPVEEIPPGEDHGKAAAGATPAREAAVRSRPARTRPLSYEDLALLNQQLLELVQSGVALPTGLGTYTDELRAGRLETVLSSLRRDLESGHPLSEAMARQGDALPPLYRSLVAAGEAGGDLTTCLSLLHEQAEVDSELDRRVRESLTYPAVTFGAALLGVVALVAWIGPMFSEIFSGMGVALPGMTRFVLTSASWINGSPILSLLLAAGVLAGTVKVVPRVIPFLLRLAVSGVQGRPLGELSRALGGFLERGLPLPAAFEAMKQAELELPAGTLDRILVRLRGGATLADSLRPEAAFPPTYVWLVGAAESRGDLPTALHSLARQHERAYRARLKIMESLVGPVALSVVGILIGGVVLSIFLPIFELQKALQQ